MGSSSRVNRFGKFRVTNGMSFGEFELDLSKPGFHCIIGENLDDAGGNRSRNATGKSNIFALLGHHLFGKSYSGYGPSEIIHDQVGKDYRSELEIIPVGDVPYFTYQYRKDGEWGNGISVYRGGSYDQWDSEENADEKLVQDISYEGIDAAQGQIQEILGISMEEWTVLCSLHDIQNDVYHPFFSGGINAPMNFIQGLFNLDYTWVKDENASRAKAVEKAIIQGTASYEGRLEMIEADLEQLPDAEELDESLTSKAIERDLKRAELKRVQQLASDLKNSADLIARHEQLVQALASYSGDPEEELERCNISLRESQDTISKMSRAISQFQYVIELEKELNHAKGYRDVVFDHYDIDSIDKLIEHRSFLTKELESYRRIEIMQSKYGADYAKLKEAGHTTFTSDTLAELEANLADIEATFNKVQESLTEIGEQHSNLMSVASSLEHVMAQEVNVQVLDSLTQVANAGVQLDTFGKIHEQYSSGVATATRELESLNLKIHEAQSFIDAYGSGECDRCGRAWEDCNDDDLETAQKNLEIYVAEREAKSSSRDSYAYFKAAIERLNAALSSSYPDFMDMEPSQLLDVHASNSVDLKSLSDNMAELKIESSQHQAKMVKLLELIPIMTNLLKANINVEDLHPLALEGMGQVHDALKTCEGDVATLRRYVEAKDKYDAARSEVPEDSDIESLQKEHDAAQTKAASLQKHIQYLNTILPQYLELNSDKFENIEALKEKLGDTDIDTLFKDRDTLDQEISTLTEELESVKNQKARREELELRKVELETSSEEVNHLKVKSKIHKAIDILTSPRGLISSHMGHIFEHINRAMNSYLDIMIQDKRKDGSKMAAYLQFERRAPTLAIYRGERRVSMRTLSSSEKARLKLAFTLAHRESVLPNKSANLLILDEVDGSSCDVNTERLWDCLNMHLERYPETGIWGITHNTAMQQSRIWNSRYRVIKEDGFSRLTREL